jgi:hypothetical protein
MGALASVEGVCDVVQYAPRGAARGWLLIEVPHGATQGDDYFRVAREMKSPLPAQLEHFFFVNTDEGAPEGAARLGEVLSRDGVGVVVARCRLPRTFIDTNRVIDLAQQGKVVAGLTAGVASYITHPDDLAWLLARHGEYHALVKRAYELVCGERQGLALQLHSYSPRSVGIEKVDENIVTALHAAYEPAVYATWPERPPVDLIAATADRSFEAAPKLTAALKAAYVEAGIAVGENQTYALHPSTMGMAYAQAWPGRVMCVELNRGLICSPFVPFAPSPVDAEKLARAVEPIARVVREAFAG